MVQKRRCDRPADRPNLINKNYFYKMHNIHIALSLQHFSVRSYTFFSFLKLQPMSSEQIRWSGLVVTIRCTMHDAQQHCSFLVICMFFFCFLFLDIWDILFSLRWFFNSCARGKSRIQIFQFIKKTKYICIYSINGVVEYHRTCTRIHFTGEIYGKFVLWMDRIA